MIKITEDIGVDQGGIIHLTCPYNNQHALFVFWEEGHCSGCRTDEFADFVKMLYRSITKEFTDASSN